MATMKVTWNPGLMVKVLEAQIMGINKTMGKCVETSKELVHTDTTALQGSLRIEGAHPNGFGGAAGQWGSFDIDYAIWQELLPGESAGGVTRVQSGGKPYLRPSADENYPELRVNIREAFEA